MWKLTKRKSIHSLPFRFSCTAFKSSEDKIQYLEGNNMVEKCENLLNNVLLYSPQKGSDPAVVFSSVVKEDGSIKRNRLYRIYSGHGYNRSN
jgi:hypothetical protein